MVPAAGGAASVSHKLWEDLVSQKSSALSAWRFEPSLMLEQNNSFADAWISQASQHETLSLTLALQRELCSTNNNNFYNIESPLPGSSSAWKCKSESDVSSGSEAGGRGGGCVIESPSRQVKNNGLSVRGKAGKRRSRAANKTPITVLNADPANFRAMVQQVTGVPLNPNATRLWSTAPAGVGMTGLVKPEPKRPPTGPGGGGCCAIQGLPTLDTSAFHFASSVSAARGGTSSSYTFAPPPPLIRTAPPQNEEYLLTEKLRAACMQSLIKNGGSGGGGGCFEADQGQGMMNFAQEADSWFNNNPDVDFSGSILL